MERDRADIYPEHHIKARVGDVSRYCLIPGDHVRGRKIAERLDDVRLVSETRGYYVYSGFHRGIPVTVCSTGIGGPQVAIAMEELGNLGADTFIRLGSAGGIDESTGVGDVVIATGAYRGGGTGDEYLPKPFPAVPHFDVLNALVTASKDLDVRFLIGPVASVDAFYHPDNHELACALRKGGILCIEMESDTEFIVGLYRRFRCGAAFVLDNGPRTAQVQVRSGRLNIAHHGKDPAYLEGEEKLIRIGLRAVEILAKGDGQDP